MTTVTPPRRSEAIDLVSPRDILECQPVTEAAATPAVAKAPGPSKTVILVNTLAVVIPFLALIAAIALLWGWGISWLHLGLLVGGYLITGFGITLGFHRLFTHRSFKTNAVVKAVLGIVGSMAMEGPIIRWVATHRQHHQHSDDEHDPHSPHGHGSGVLGVLRGFYHAHMGWLLREGTPDMNRYVPDLKSDRVVSWVSRLFLLWVVLGLAIPTVLAYLVTGTLTGAALGLLWGGLVRIFFVHHITWSINSVCHLWGSRPFRSADESRNNFIFGVLGFGEGWHNSHHAFPTSARHGLRWWELDTTYMAIRVMSWFGLAREIRVPSPERIAEKMQRQPRTPR